MSDTMKLKSFSKDDENDDITSDTVKNYNEPSQFASDADDKNNFSYDSDTVRIQRTPRTAFAIKNEASDDENDNVNYVSDTVKLVNPTKQGNTTDSGEEDSNAYISDTVKLVPSKNFEISSPSFENSHDSDKNLKEALEMLSIEKKQVPLGLNSMNKNSNYFTGILLPSIQHSAKDVNKSCSEELLKILSDRDVEKKGKYSEDLIKVLMQKCVTSTDASVKALTSFYIESKPANSFQPSEIAKPEGLFAQVLLDRWIKRLG